MCSIYKKLFELLLNHPLFLVVNCSMIYLLFKRANVYQTICHLTFELRRNGELLVFLLQLHQKLITHYISHTESNYCEIYSVFGVLISFIWILNFGTRKTIPQDGMLNNVLPYLKLHEIPEILARSEANELCLQFHCETRSASFFIKFGFPFFFEKKKQNTRKRNPKENFESENTKTNVSLVVRASFIRAWTLPMSNYIFALGK